MSAFLYVFFFFQAEDGIRDGTVTGVQTCALPISCPLESAHSPQPVAVSFMIRPRVAESARIRAGRWAERLRGGDNAPVRRGRTQEIGRASCRERAEISVVAGALRKKVDRSDRCA